MQIGLVADKLDAEGGGSNMSLDLLARSLQTHGHSVSIITMNVAADNSLPHSYPYDIYTPNINERTPFHAFRSVVKTFFEFEDDFDIYHVFVPFLTSMAGRYRSTGGKNPVVGRLNSYSLFCTNSTMMDGDCHRDCSIYNKFDHDNVDKNEKISRIPQYIYNDQLSMRFAGNIDKFFAQSPAVKDIYSEAGFNQDNIVVVPNFFDKNFTANTILPFENRSIDLLFVGQLKYGKGVDILLDSLKIIEDEISVKIVGDGEQKEDLVENYDIDGVDFCGWIDHDELPSMYNNSKYFIHPGRWPDPCPRTVLEALQHYCIPIVSDIGGPPWMVGDAGYVFKSGDSLSLSNQISDIIHYPSPKRDNELIKKRMDKFSKQTIINKILSQYRNLINKK